MPAKLKNIRLREISFVDKGASGDADNRPRVAFWKRKTDQTTLSKEHPVTKLTVEIAKKVNAAIQLRKEGMPEGAQAVLDSIKSTLSEEQWALVEMMLAGAAPAPVAAAALPPAKTEETPAPGAPTPDEEKPMDKALEKRLADSEARTVEMEKAHKAEVEKLTKRLDASEKSAAEEVKKARIVRFEKLAATDLKYLQGKPEEIAKRLADLEDVLSKEEFAAHVQMLKGASELIAKGKTLDPRGSSAAGNAAGSAYEELLAKAGELMAKDAKLTQPKAMVKVSKDPANLELVKRYREERSAN